MKQISYFFHDFRLHLLCILLNTRKITFASGFQHNVHCHAIPTAPKTPANPIPTGSFPRPCSRLLSAAPVNAAGPVVVPLAVPLPPNPLQMYPPSPIPSVTVFVLTTSAVPSSAKPSSVPETVIAGPPGESVCVPMTYADAELAVVVEEP